MFDTLYWGDKYFVQIRNEFSYLYEEEEWDEEVGDEDDSMPIEEYYSELGQFDSISVANFERLIKEMTATDYVPIEESLPDLSNPLSTYIQLSEDQINRAIGILGIY